VAELDGLWDVKRTGGFLPPLVGVRKRITGTKGTTVVGPVRMPFDVRGRQLHYRRPFQGFVDVLEPAGDGDDAFHGRATFMGREFGTFDLRRIEKAR
jgi:hypothetical protein